jgi:hypothetical protein
MPRPASTRQWVRLFVLVLTCAFLAVPSSAAQASPADLCAGPLAAVQAVMVEIEAHNARPHTFVLPRQQAAYNAYNAEAAQLTAKLNEARGRLTACVEAMKTLEDTAAGSPPLGQPQAETLQKIADAVKQVPAGWTPPPPPAAGENWRVPTTSPVRPLYKVLRGVSPPTFGNVTLRGQRRPSIGAADNAYPAGSGYVVGRAATGLSATPPDHIIPLAEIIYMPNFLKLTPHNMYQVVNARVNLQWLTTKSNASKSSKSVAGMSGVDPQWQANQLVLENEVRAKLQATIDLLLKSQG